LLKLDAHLENPDPDIRDKAIDNILRCHGYNRDKCEDGGIVARLLVGDKKNPKTSDIDALIIQKQRERGLEP
jgi:hypothetical protein